jgi:hypothetical protein
MHAQTRRTAALLALSLGLLAGCGPQAAETERATTQGGITSFTTLREAAEASGRFFGVSMQVGLLSEADYTAIAAREFDKATDSAGNLSPASRSTTVLLPISKDTTPPTTPTNVTVSSASEPNLTLRWTASKDDVGVVLYQVQSGGSLVATTTSTSVTITDLSAITAETNYSVTVRALDAAGNASDPTAPVRVDIRPNCALGCSGGSSEP